MEKITDIELAKRCKNRDRAAQKMLYDSCARDIFSMCLSYARDRHEAKDFLQDGFLKVYGNIGKYNGRGSLKGWIRNCIKNNILDHLRKKKIVFSDSEYVANSQLLVGDSSDSNIEYELANKLARVELKMKLIPQKARVVLNLYAIEGYSHQEISNKLNISVGTSKSQLNRARVLLRKHLEG